MVIVFLFSKLGQAVEQRVCPFCKDVVETEIHFVMVCPVYEQYRTQMLNELSFDAVFTHLNTSEKFVRLMKQYYKEAATYIQKSWLLRQSKLFM